MTPESIHDYFEIYPQMFLFWQVVSFILGCCIGSFLNVCIWRIPRGMSISSPPSHCPKCGHRISALENIPLLSWIFLGGKCHSCRSPITIRYFLVELMTGLLFALLFLKVMLMHQPPTVLFAYYVLTAIAVCSAFTDYELGVIPNEFTYFGMICGLGGAAEFPDAWGNDSRLTALLLSAVSLAAGGGLLALCAIIGKKIFIGRRWMGGCQADRRLRRPDRTSGALFSVWPDRFRAFWEFLSCASKEIRQTEKLCGSARFSHFGMQSGFFREHLSGCMSEF